MDDMREQDHDALVAVLDQALRDEGRTEPPEQAEAGDWLCDNSEQSKPNSA